jgi:HlyD family secretion protein
MNREAQLYEQINNLRSTRITMEQFKLDLSQQVLDIEYQLREKERAYKQNSELWEKGLLSKEEYLKSKDDAEYFARLFEQKKDKQEQDLKLRNAQVDQLESSVMNLQNNLEIINENLENLTIKAPVTGQLASLNADIGELITSGTRFGQIDVLDGYKVRIPIDEHYITRVNLDQKGEVEIAGIKYELKINKIYPEVRDGRFEVDMNFTGTQPDDIKRGQNLQVKLELGNLSKTVLLSRGGFYQSSGGNWIFVFDEPGGTAVKRKIRLGRQNPEYFEVLDGLASGEMVITSSYDNFGDAEKIILK